MKETTTSTSGPAEEIYIGFVKEEGFGSREGRKGRVIKDDPRKYPSRDAFGTGGWAGGEAGLWQLREQVKVSSVSAFTGRHCCCLVLPDPRCFF